MQLSAHQERTRPAGEFSAWLQQTRQAIELNGAADVPCGACNACCRSSYFIRIRADEADAINNIPAPLLFPSPGEPDVFVLGFDENGHCPMLVDQQCSIYEHRPQTCRTYDCRVFAASGIAPEKDRPDVGKAVAAWAFSYAAKNSTDPKTSAEHSKNMHRALLTAAQFLQEQQASIPQLTDNPLHLALTALECQPLFTQEPLPDKIEMLKQVKHHLNVNA